MNKITRCLHVTAAVLVSAQQSMLDHSFYAQNGGTIEKFCLSFPSFSDVQLNSFELVTKLVTQFLTS